MQLIPFIYERLLFFILVFTRISALFSTFVMFRRELVNARVILSLTAGLSFYVLLLDKNNVIHVELFSLPMMIAIFFQFFLGFIAGLILNIAFEIITAMGQIYSMQTGLSMASMFDSKMGNITSLTHFYSYSIMLIFLMMNGHLLLIKIMLDSFTTIPVMVAWMPTQLISGVLAYSSVIFSGAIILSITIIIAIMLTNIAMALMSKFAPQFNLFSIGINLMLVLGLLCAYTTFDLFVDKGSHFLQDALIRVKTVLTKAS